MKYSNLSRLIIALLACVGTTQALAQTPEKPWLVRARAVYMDTANQSDPIPALGVTASDTVHVSKKTIPELDISYFFTKNIAAELVLTIPQKHDVTLVAGGTSTKLGTLKHLPPTLSLQYHFMPDNAFKPYVGVGVNYTRIISSDMSVAGIPLTLEKSSVGLALGAGADYKISDNVYLNFDIKKLQIRTDVMANGQKVTAAKVDPYLVGVGIGVRF